MCGIIGVVDNYGINIKEFKEMCSTLRHRGPDDEGYLFAQQGEFIIARGDDTIKYFNNIPHIDIIKNKYTIGLAHRRLSIIDISHHGHQPMLSENGNVIVYNGEIYNFLEIKKELESFGITFFSNSDTEVVLKSYEVWGEKCVEKFIGMWAFIIYDSKKNILFISRDRFAIKPLYYYEIDEGILFASEIKAFKKYKKFKTKINLKAFQEYFHLGKIQKNSYTLFENVKELEPGSNMIYFLKKNKYLIKKYYNLKDKENNIYKINFSKEELYLNYAQLFSESIKLHLRSDVEVGSCLSGGLDSSAIVSESVKYFSKNNKYKTFSVIFPQKKVDESFYIKKVVNTYKDVIDSYYTTPVSEKYWNNLERIIYYQDLPIGSTSVFLQWEVMRLAHEKGIKVLLDGQGADESLGGYSYFGGAYLIELLTKFKIKKFLKELKNLKYKRNISPLKEILRALSHSLPDAIQKYLRSKQRLGTMFLSEELKNSIRELRIEYGKFISYKEHCIEAIINGLHSLLRYEDRNSMAYSIEARVPFLDHRLVEFSLNLPTENKIVNGWTKFPIRKIISDRLPKEVVWRKDKKGFISPEDEWKNELKDKLVEYIYSLKSPYFNNEKLISVTLDNKLNRNILSEYWKAISTLKWIEINNI